MRSCRIFTISSEAPCSIYLEAHGTYRLLLTGLVALLTTGATDIRATRETTSPGLYAQFQIATTCHEIPNNRP